MTNEPNFQNGQICDNSFQKDVLRANKHLAFKKKTNPNEANFSVNLCVLCGKAKKRNEANFKINQIAATSFFLKTNTSSLKSALDKNEPKRTQFLLRTED